MLRHGSSLSAVRERRIEYELSYDRPTGAGAVLPPFKNTLGLGYPAKSQDFVGRGGATERANFGTFCPKAA